MVRASIEVFAITFDNHEKEEDHEEGFLDVVGSQEEANAMCELHKEDLKRNGHWPDVVVDWTPIEVEIDLENVKKYDPYQPNPKEERLYPGRRWSANRRRHQQ
jgi:hypothetical protein